MTRWLDILSAFSYQLKHRASKHHRNVDRLSRQFQCLDCKQCAAIEHRDGGPGRAEIEAELSTTNQVVKVQVQNPAARDQPTGKHAMYKVVKTGESLSAEELQLGGTKLKKLYARREALPIRTDV